MRHRMGRARHHRRAAAGGERGEDPCASRSAISACARGATARGRAARDRRHRLAAARGGARSFRRRARHGWGAGVRSPRLRGRPRHCAGCHALIRGDRGAARRTRPRARRRTSARAKPIPTHRAVPSRARGRRQGRRLLRQRRRHDQAAPAHDRTRAHERCAHAVRRRSCVRFRAQAEGAQPALSAAAWTHSRPFFAVARAAPAIHICARKDRVMNWISNVVRPKIRNYFARRDTPENLWIKCPETGQLVFYKDVEANQFVIPGSNYHMRMGAMMRLKSMFDNQTWFDIAIPAVPLDPLRFRDERRYTERLKDARAKTGTNDAIKLGFGKLDGLPVVMGVQDFDFMGGSLGMAAGEAVIKGLETAVDKATPFIMFAASGGARMQEGIFSLMQLPRTTLAVQMLREARRPYIVVLTNPTTGGVTASYAMLGDVHIAEPGALIGFAGPRVIEQTIREKLPDGFQRAEYLKDHGMVDMVVHRHHLRPTISNLCRLLTKARPNPPADTLLVPSAG